MEEEEKEESVLDAQVSCRVQLELSIFPIAINSICCSGVYCAKYCREILFCLCEACSSMAFLCLSSSLEPDWIRKAAAGKFIGTAFCWELLWKVQVSDELLPAIP